MTKFCEMRITPEGQRVLECIDPVLRVITREMPTARDMSCGGMWWRLHNVIDGIVAIEAEGFTLAYERPL